MRAALYARFSSENQRDESIADQLAVCRRYAANQGWTIVEEYTDAAISGASSHRPGYQQMLRDADKRRFDVVVAESVDRLGRRLADTAALFDQFQYLGIQVYAPAYGQLTAMHIGIMGTMAQLQLKDLKEKTWRGQLGRVEDGKVPGGRAYGYDVLPAKDKNRGFRQINPEEAAVVRMIFEWYADGVSPRQIAHRLNEQHIPGPRGQWHETAIRGHRERGTGLLNNEIYRGHLVWNKCSFIKNPTTGKREPRPNPQEEWKHADVPELRIVSDDLWNRVKTRQEGTTFKMQRDDEGNALNRAHRQKFLLSGLLYCDCCGSRYTIMAKDRYGCAGRRSKGTCSNSKTISRQDAERRVLTALKERLLTPDQVGAFTAKWQEAVKRQAKTQGQDHAALQRQVADCDRKMEGIMRAIEDGMYTPTMKERHQDLETKKSDLLVKLQRVGAAPKTVAFHPNLAQAYTRMVGNLQDLLADPNRRDRAMEAIRSMITEITVKPTDTNEVALLLKGDLANILAVCMGSAEQEEARFLGESGLQLSVVAGAGFEPATFRL